MNTQPSGSRHGWDRTGEVTRNLLSEGGLEFEGALPLVNGANDVELRIEGDAGLAGLLRFRVYSAPDLPSEYLTTLERENEGLATRLDELTGEVRKLLEVEQPRELEVLPEPPEAGGSESGGGR